MIDLIRLWKNAERIIIAKNNIALQRGCYWVCNGENVTFIKNRIIIGKSVFSKAELLGLVKVGVYKVYKYVKY